MNDYYKFDLKFTEDSSNNYKLENNEITASAFLGGSCIFVSSKTICSSNKNVLKELSSTTYKNDVLTTEYTVTPVGSTENTLTLPLVYKYEIKNYNSDGDTRTTATINATFKVPPTTDAILYL
jgi:hypothetical protein